MIKRYKQTEITELVTILKNDGVISVPTDTVYGICARISKKAHDKLVLVKNRPSDKAFPVMCANIEQIKSIAFVNEKEERMRQHNSCTQVQSYHLVSRNERNAVSYCCLNSNSRFILSASFFCRR